MQARCIETSISIGNGLELAYKLWEPLQITAKTMRFAALHGWLDNAATFDSIAAKLCDALDVTIACFDLPGHGKSSWRSPQSYYSTPEYAANILEALEELNWDSVYLLGHSLGGGLCTIIAGSFPAFIRGVVLIDSSGLPLRPPAQAPKIFANSVVTKRSHVRQCAVKKEVYLLKHEKDIRGMYSSIDEAIDRRVASVRDFPGNQFLSREASVSLTSRALVPVIDPAQSPSDPNSTASDTSSEVPTPHYTLYKETDPLPKVGEHVEIQGADLKGVCVGYRFGHDRRATASHLMSADECVNQAFLKEITTAGLPVLIVRGISGWPFPEDIAKQRTEILEPVLTLKQLPGGHHLHLDPDSAPAVFDAIVEWFRIVNK